MEAKGERGRTVAPQDSGCRDACCGGTRRSSGVYPGYSSERNGGKKLTRFTLAIIVSLVAGMTSQSRADETGPSEAAQAAVPGTSGAGEAKPGDGKSAGGKLVICGGGALPIQLRNRFIELAGGAAAQVVVITTASVYADTDKMESKLGFWREQGLASLKVLHTRSRRTADDPNFAAPLREATGVWFVGGNQNWLTETYLGTATEREIRGVLARCGVVGGTSAGAAIMSPIMIRRDKPEIQTGPGFGFLPGTVVDQHFLKRNRQSRLLKVLDAHPDLVGLGIDEGTGVVVDGNHLSVVGESQVVVCSPGTSQGRQSVQSLEPGTETDLKDLRTLIAQVPKPLEAATAAAPPEGTAEPPMPASAVSARVEREASTVGE